MSIGYLMGSRVSETGTSDSRLNSYSYSASYFSSPVYTSDEQRFQKILIGRPEYGETFAVHNPKRFGKSLTVTFMIIERMKREPWLKLVSNSYFDLSPLYPLKNQSDFVFLDDIEMLKSIGSGTIVYIDEMRRYTDSRMAMSQKSRFISNLLADTGKQKVDLYYTDQDSKAVDKRVRINVDYILAPFYDYVTGWCRVLIWDKMEKFEMFQEGWQAWNPPIFEFAFWAPPYFKFYKTERKVEDYHMKFKVKSHAILFKEWCERKGLDPDGDSIVLYSTTEGETYSSPEMKAMLKFLELVPEEDWEKWK